MDGPQSKRVLARAVTDGFTDLGDYVLDTTARTQTVFRAENSSKGPRGWLIRLKKGPNGFAEVNDVSFTQVAPDCGIKIELHSDALRELTDQLIALREIDDQFGTKSGVYRVTRGRPEQSEEEQIVRRLVAAGAGADLWDALTSVDPDTASQVAWLRVQHDRLQHVGELRAAIDEHPGDEDFWQEFFQERSWMLEMAFAAPVVFLSGEAYLGGKRAEGRQGKGGVATDFLLQDESTKSFAVVEIKTPGAKLVGPAYRGDKKNPAGRDNEVFEIHGELSGGLVQLRNQIAVAVKDFDSTLRDDYPTMTRVHPRGVLLAGLHAGLQARQRESFNHFRHSLYGTTIIAFDELLRRLEMIVGPAAA